MQKLYLVGFTTGLDGLIFSVRKGSTSGGFTVDLDDALVQMVTDAERVRSGGMVVSPVVDSRQSRHSWHGSSLNPRELQDRLRTGWSVEEVAAEAGTDVAWVNRFAAPVRAEQAQVLERARRVTFDKARLGPSALDLGSSVRRNLAERGLRVPVDEADDGWSAFQLDEGYWVIRFGFTSRGRAQRAEWVFELAEGRLSARDRLASQLGYVDGRTTRRLVLPDPPPAVPKAPAVRRTTGTRQAAGRQGAGRRTGKPPVKRVPGTKRADTTSVGAVPATMGPVGTESVSIEVPEPKKAAARTASRTPATPRAATPKKKAAPKKAAPKKAAPKKVAPKKAAPKKVAPKKAAPKKVAPKKVAPRKVAPRKVAPKKVAPKKAAPRKAASGRAARNVGSTEVPPPPPPARLSSLASMAEGTPVVEAGPRRQTTPEPATDASTPADGSQRVGTSATTTTPGPGRASVTDTSPSDPPASGVVGSGVVGLDQDPDQGDDDGGVVPEPRQLRPAPSRPAQDQNRIFRSAGVRAGTGRRNAPPSPAAVSASEGGAGVGVHGPLPSPAPVPVPERVREAINEPIGAPPTAEVPAIAGGAPSAVDLEEVPDDNRPGSRRAGQKGGGANPVFRPDLMRSGERGGAAAADDPWDRPSFGQAPVTADLAPWGAPRAADAPASDVSSEPSAMDSLASLYPPPGDEANQPTPKSRRRRLRRG